MKSKHLFKCTAFAVFYIVFMQCPVAGDIPDDFPGTIVTVYDENQVSDGYIFVNVNYRDASSIPSSYLMMLDNDGLPVWYNKVVGTNAMDFKVQPNGYMSHAHVIGQMSFATGAYCNHIIWDDSYNQVETISSGNRYVSEIHDMTMLPNGNVLVLGYYLNEIDLSQHFAEGHPGALLTGGFIQELEMRNGQREVVFQWRSWDHFEFDDYAWPWYTPKSDAIPHVFHLNTINLDSDGHILLGTVEENWKINRQTGEVMWTLGGGKNDFTVQGAGASLDHFGGHALYRLPNNNVLFYDNADHPGIPGGDPTSQAHEYSLDEVNMIATHVWSYTPSANVAAWNAGNVQRLPNGNTFVGWGGFFINNIQFPACTEVTPAGDVVFEMFFEPAMPAFRSYRAFRFPYPPASQAIDSTVTTLGVGNTRVFGNTGVTIKVNSMDAPSYNECTVTREPYAPVYPVFSGKPPRVLPVRVSMDQSGIFAMHARIDFDRTSLGFDNPDELTVYYRSSTSQGLFLPQSTTNTGSALRVTLDLSITGADMGEFIFCYDDLLDVAYPPILNQPESYRGAALIPLVVPWKADPNVVYEVNQNRDIMLSWSPKGFARWYDLQIATDETFSTIVLDKTYTEDAYEVWNGAADNTPYWYRVRTKVWNADSTAIVDGAWSVGRFMTVPPMIEVRAPVAGEYVENGTDYLIQWRDNIAEEVIIELFKGAVMVDTIKTEANVFNPGWSTFDWEVFGYEAGIDYSIKISSSTDPTLYDFSDAFRIDIPIGDFDTDGCVQLDDFAVFASQWSRVQAGLEADLDGDGDVDLGDLQILTSNWIAGECL